MARRFINYVMFCVFNLKSHICFVYHFLLISYTNSVFVCPTSFTVIENKIIAQYKPLIQDAGSVLCCHSEQ
jgi:hypothetical protein